MRRNTFWLAYATDRTTSIGNGWAFGIDDEDVAQLLPVRGDQFEQGVRHLASACTFRFDIFSPGTCSAS